MAAAPTATATNPTATPVSPIETPTELPTEAPTDTPTSEPTATATVTPAPSPTASPTVTQGETPGVLANMRVISYYGHPNSAQMGILGEFSKEELLGLLQEQGAAYAAADPSRPVQLAFEIIATVAQPLPGDDGTYVAYSGDELIQEYLDFCVANNLILILDLQIGWDTIPNQIELVRKYIEHPNVHIALDPEFSTGPDRVPGEFIGEVDGANVQKAVEMISQIVREKQLPSKMLIVHQFEAEMIYNKDQIKPLPGVDVVIDMDGFGGQDAKAQNYALFVRDELIEYGGIKLFYKQDDPLFTPEQIVALDPSPVVVIYQ